MGFEADSGPESSSYFSRFPMRGHENPQASMFSYVSLEQHVPKDHTLRTLRTLFALLVQILFTIRSERELVE